MTSMPTVAANVDDRHLLETNLSELFASQARATPDAIAIVAHEGNATYGALAARMETVSQFLAQRRLAPEQPVAVLMRRSVELVAVLLGILRAGGAYVPLDPQDPPARNRRILENSGATLVVSDRTSRESFRSALADLNTAKVEFANVDQIFSSDPTNGAPPAAPGW